MHRFTKIILAAVLVAGQAQACEVGRTTVAEVYPTSTALPENLLRFYVYFSAPMGQQDILPAIDLVDAEDKVIDGVFLSNRFDLWSPDRTRLTLHLDPGRVKTGLQANMAMGRAFAAGETYSLRVSTNAQDADGCHLAAPHSFTFQATAADTTSPTPADWDLTQPQAGTRDPLAVSLDGAIDHLSLAYRLRILDDTGNPVAGRISLGEAEAQWIFAPDMPWQDTTHVLNVDPLLEDLAGNRMDAVFDLDLGTGGPSMVQSMKRTIPFTPAGASP
jgi:hypothetical protein